MKNEIQKVVDLINRIDLRVLMFAVIFLATFSIKLSDNEEEYFVFAKAFADPHWIAGALSIKDVPGTRIIFDTVVGWALGFASFEQVAAGGRTLCAILFAFPLSLFFKKLRLSHMEAVFLLTAFVVSHQSFFGNEWIFRSFETKVVSYVFVFYSIYYLIEQRIRLCVIFAAAAIYFHVLVGGWYVLALFACLFFRRTPLKEVLTSALMLAVLLTPLAFYLAGAYLVHNPNVIDGVTVSWVYAYVRNPHHLDVLGRLVQGKTSVQIEVALSAVMGWLCIKTCLNGKDPAIRALCLLSLALFAQQFLSLLVAFFDTQGVFLKFYPYRTSALSLFLSLTLLLLLFKQSGWLPSQESTSPVADSNGRAGWLAVVTVMLAFMVLGLGSRLYINAVDSYRVAYPSAKQLAMNSTSDWIRRNTDSAAVVLDLEDRSPGHLDFIRQTQRDSFSVYKFVPTTNLLIYEWYLRVLARDRVVKDISVLPAIKGKYRIDYILSERPLPGDTLRPVYQNEFFHLYAV